MRGKAVSLSKLEKNDVNSIASSARILWPQSSAVFLQYHVCFLTVPLVSNLEVEEKIKVLTKISIYQKVKTVAY